MPSFLKSLLNRRRPRLNLIKSHLHTSYPVAAYASIGKLPTVNCDAILVSNVRGARFLYTVSPAQMLSGVCERRRAIS